MNFTPAEDAAMLARAQETLAHRARRRGSARRLGLATLALACLAITAFLWLPRTAEQDAAHTRATGTLVAAPPPAHAAPPWLEVIEGDEAIESAFAEAGQCARVIRVNHQIATIACELLEPPLPIGIRQEAEAPPATVR